MADLRIMFPCFAAKCAKLTCYCMSAFINIFIIVPYCSTYQMTYNHVSYWAYFKIKYKYDMRLNYVH